MDERLRFVARLLEGEAMSEATKFSTDREHGLEALTDRSKETLALSS